MAAEFDTASIGVSAVKKVKIKALGFSHFQALSNRVGGYYFVFLQKDAQHVARIKIILDIEYSLPFTPHDLITPVCSLSEAIPRSNKKLSGIINATSKESNLLVHRAHR